VLGDNPESVANPSVSYGRAATLAALAPYRLQQRVPGRHDSNVQQRLDRRIEKVFLHVMNDPMFHLTPREQSTMDDEFRSPRK
jgi:hypothetical protein